MPAEPAIEAAIDWLLQSPEPAVAYLTRRDILGEAVEYNPEEILAGPLVKALMAGQQPDGSFGGHPYKKWTGAHWRLVSLVELAAPPGEPRLIAAANTVLDWLTDPGHRESIKAINGLTRVHASQEGNAIAVCSRFGIAGDPRVEFLAKSLAAWQWPDGGWNCDVKATGERSSFHESFEPAWGLHEYAVATGASWAKDAAGRFAELLLSHHLFRSLRSGHVIKSEWLVPHYPPYWHYDIYQGLLVLSRLGNVDDPRASEAIDRLVRRQRPDGRWCAGSYWWKPPGSSGAADAADWGRSAPSEMLTLNALRILRAAGRLI